MEEHKKRFLKKLLQRRGEESAKDYVMATKDLEKWARRCYSEPVSLSSDQFTVMMLLDACFIVEVFCYTAQNEWNDPIFWIICIPGKLGRDLLLADNQLPFFVLQKFYDMAKTPEEDFHELISKFFSYVFQQALPRGEPNADEEINHLVGFVHKSLWVPRPKTEQAENGEFIRIRCATELQEAGISTAKDVKILCESGILINYLGDEEVVAKMINRLGDSVCLPPTNNYSEIRKNVNEYCADHGTSGWRTYGTIISTLHGQSFPSSLHFYCFYLPRHKLCFQL
ncbi:hypothetical protein KPL71_026814 [Citrus sinensis]|uniref:Uncharacterized protein n=1 Tax=Citrus sinensis TaxID=2711 RepID=A0ACB8I219_CITSI|nr:hypothetical protein KPL71_026814 [Citrus sinensis]